MSVVLQNIKKPNGYVLFRDYAVGDLAQERLTGKDQKISENFFVRGDGTRAFYFSNEFLTSLFKEHGFDVEEVGLCCKQVENRARELVMNWKMAEAIPESKSAAKMAKVSQQPPPEYIVKVTKFGPIETCLPLGAFPVINLSLLLQSPDELDKLRSSLSSLGCFQIIGHGMSDSFLDRLREVAVEFFQLPDEEKLKSARAANESEGYGSDVVVSDKQVLDWTQRLILGALPVHRRKLNLWPQNPPQFSEILDEYAMRLKTVKEVLFKAVAKSLNLEENCFLDHLGDQRLLTTRFNFYPPCPRPDLVHGVKPHTDLSVLTVLLQDREIEGLQVRVDGEWKRVPVIPNALVVNLGDQMQIMTNGIYKSPLHRVVTNSEKLRISIATFTELEPENEIGPVPQLIDEQRPRVYRNVKNYGAINYECYQKGLVALETVRV